MEWQPIETAPKDVMETVLIASSEGVQLAWWSMWCKGWVTPEGKDVWAEPTNWMPLPAPPVTP